MSTDSVPLSRVAAPTAAQRLKAAFMQSLGGLLVSVRTIFLPHALAAGALFVLAVYAAYTCWATWLPAPFSWLAGLAALIGCGALALAYALVTSLVCALRHAAVNVEDFLYELFASLKEKVRGKIDAMDEGVAKQQAKVILENSLREVFAPLKELRFNTAPALVAGVFVSLLTFVSRAVFMARLARIPAATVSFSAVFASRATLVGALILNFRWLATLVLWLLYALGAAAFLFNVWLVW